MKYYLDTNTPFSHQKDVCDWCDCLLDRIHNVYKGKDSQRLYCGKEHHQKGEERALRRAVKAAGEVS